MKESRKTAVLFSCLFLLLLASCSTSSFMGLSKAKYVESEITEINQSLAAIEAMETRLLDVERVASDISTLQDQIDQIIQIENELSASNAALNTRVDGLPKEIVVGLINAMQIYLDSLSP